MKNESIGKNAILNGIKTSLSIIFPLITYPYASRVLQVENIGKVNFSNSIISYFVLIAGLGISTYAIREGAMIRDDKKKLENFSNEIFTINFISTFVATILLGILIVCWGKLNAYLPLVLIQSLTMWGNLIGIVWMYSILEEYAYMAVRGVVVHLVALILMFGFVRNKEDYIIYAATSIVANVGANIFNFIHARKYVHIRLTAKMNLKKHLRPIMILFATSVTSTIYVNSDKTLLGVLSTDYYVGLYSVAVNVYSVLKQTLAAIVIVALPRLSNYVAAGLQKEFYDVATKIIKTLILLLLPVVVGVMCISEDVILLIGGENYLEASLALKILAISLLFSIFAIFCSNVILLPMKEEATIFKASIVSAIINIGLNLVLLKNFRHNAAALTTLVAEAYMFMRQYRTVKKYYKSGIDIKFIISVFIATGLLGVSATIFHSLYTAHVILRIILEIFVSAMIYISALLIMKNEMVYIILHKIMSKWRENKNE